MPENQSNMMETSRYGTGVGRGTMVCGAPKTWFPMRVTRDILRIQYYTLDYYEAE